MNSNEQYSKFTLHFIRKNGGSASNDDMIEIQPKWRNLSGNEISLLEYEVSTTFSAQSMTTGRSQKNTMRLMGNSLVQYLESVLNLALLDSEPFESIQIDAPCIPSVLLKLDTMPNAVQYILQSLQVCLPNWPTVQVSQIARNQPVARHIIFADETNNRTSWNNY